MDEKLKVIASASETAEKDEALLECIKEVWNLFDNRVQKLDEKGGSIESSLTAATCRLNNDESLIKLSENKQLILQNVLQEDAKPIKNTVKEEPPNPKSLADYVHESVQSGLRLVDQKQICVEVHSDMTDETLKIFEDMNPHLIRDLPPLIGSNEFETGNFVKHRTTKTASPVDDVVINVPQSNISKNIPNTMINGAVAYAAPPPPPPSSKTPIIPVPTSQPSPTSLMPTIQSDAGKRKEEVPRRGPIIITPPTSVPSSAVTRSDEPDMSDVIPPPPAQNDIKPPNIEDSSLPPNGVDRSQINRANVNSRAPPNLTEIIKAVPRVEKRETKKKPNMSLFTDDEDDDNDEPIPKSNVATYPSATSNPESLMNKVKPPPRMNVPVPPPQLKPRTKLPQPEAPLRKSSDTSGQKKSPPSNPKPLRTKPQKSLFSSSDEEDEPTIRLSKPQKSTVTTEVPEPKQSKPVAPQRRNVSNTEKPSSSLNHVKPELNESAASTITNTKKPAPNTSTKAKRLFDDSDDEDDFFSKPTPKSVVEKAVPQPQPVQKEPKAKVVRKSMFSSSDSD